MLYLNKEAMEGLCTMAQAIDLCGQAARAHAQGKALVPLRTNLDLPQQGGQALFMPGFLGGVDALGVKIVSVYPGNSQKNLPAVPATMVMLDETMRAADVAAVRYLCGRARRVICRNIGQLPLAIEAQVPFDVACPLAVANAHAARCCADLGARRIYLADEVPPRVAASLASAVPAVEIVHGCPGARELMVMEHCVLSVEGPCGGDCAACTRRREPRMLVDASGAHLPVVVDAHGRSRVFDAR